MLIIPAIDLRGGNCVRLKQGKLEQETIYSRDPVFVAKMFQAKGAQRIHVVDLDGAFVGASQNLVVLKKIREAVSIEIEFGGGIRKPESVKSLVEMGINKIIIGTIAVTNRELVKSLAADYPDNIILAIDVTENKIAIGGWKEITQYDALEFAGEMKQIGIKEIITTDIKRDGMMTGPNLNGIKRICRSGLPVIASGGISAMEDVTNICKLENDGVFGMIIGRAVYDETVKIEEAIKLCLQKE